MRAGEPAAGHSGHDRDRQVRRAAEGWSDEQYADSGGVPRHRAALIVALGPPLAPGDTVLDLACGDAGLAEPLLDARAPLRRRRPLRADGRRRPGAVSVTRAEILDGDLNEFVPPAPVQATTCFRAIYYARDRRGVLPARRGVHREEARLRPESAPVPRRRGRAPTSRPPASAQVELRPFFSPQRVSLARPLAAALRARGALGPARPACARASGSATWWRRHALRHRPEREAVADLAAEQALVGAAERQRRSRSARSAPRRGTAAAATAGRTVAPSRCGASSAATSVTCPMCGCLSAPSTSVPIVTRTPAGGTGAPQASTRETSTTA